MPGRRGRWRARCGAVGRARAHWASPHSLGEPVLGEPSNEVGRAIKRGWASQCQAVGRASKRGWGEPPNEVGASHQTRLGEPVLRSRWASHQTRLGRAIKRGWGEPSNEVGRASAHGASHPTFTAASTPASKLRLLGACAECLLGTSRACSARLVPARHCARLVHVQFFCRSALCLLATFGSAPARTVPARHVWSGARSAPPRLVKVLQDHT